MNINKLDIDDYKDKPVELLLLDIGEDFTDYKFIDDPPLKLIGCQFNYKNDMRVIVYISSFEHLERFNADRKWELKKFKKEKVLNFKIVKKND
jgi:hypothetical protein